MRSKKSFCWLLIAVLILASTVGCEATVPAAIELVPQHANLIGNIQVSKIINDQDLIGAYDRAEKESGYPQTSEEALNELVEETGIDFRDFSEAVIFADLTRVEQEEYVGVIVEGTFDKKQWVHSCEEKMEKEFTTSDYKGCKLYIDEQDDFGIAFLSDKLLLLGSTGAVKDAIDVSKGDRKQVGGIILDTYNQLGDALVKSVFEFPEEARRALIEEQIPSEIPISLESFTDIDMLGFALNKEGETISIRINPHFLSMDSAEDAKNTLSGFIMLYKGMGEEPEIKELLGKIKVSVIDSWLTIAFEITLSEIEQLSETFQQ